MSLDVQERQEFIKKFDQDIINDDTANVVYLKAILALLQNSSKLNMSWTPQINQDVLTDQQQVRSVLTELLDKWIDVVTNTNVNEVYELKTYKTGEIAKFFGVSQTSINKWIKEGRFVGVERQGENKHIRIPENTVYVNRGGKRFILSDIVKLYEREMQEQADLEGNDQDLNEFDFLLKQCLQFEEKYKGEYKETLGKKAPEDLTSEERIDKDTWKYFSMRLADAKRRED